MKPSSFLIVAFILDSLGGCSGITKPYDNLDLTVKGDTVATNTGTIAIQDGVPASPYGNDLYTLETGFQAILEAPNFGLEAIAVDTAAAVLDPSAVTKAQLDSDIATLNTSILALHTAIVNSTVTTIEVQHKAALAAKAKNK